MKKEDLNRVMEVLSKTKKEPYYVKTIVVNGFKFLIHYDSKSDYFLGTMLFSPTWPHSNGLCSKCQKGFVSEMNRMIEESIIIFTNGGHFKETDE